MPFDFGEMLQKILDEHREKSASEGIEIDEQDAMDFFTDILISAIREELENAPEPDPERE